MTNEEVIKRLKEARNTIQPFLYVDEAIDYAIKVLEQQPSEDCISRKSVDTLVDELARAISDERCCISRGRSTATIMQDILNLPSVTPQPRWIPVSERLPETDGIYLTYIENPYDSQLSYVMICDYIRPKWFPVDETASSNVVAWMPLPEPYKAQKKECVDCKHYGKLSLDCGRCDDNCSMFAPQESEDKE